MEQTELKPIRILVVSQEYDGYDNLGGVKKNVKKLDSVYARLLKNKGDNFRSSYLITYFFDGSGNFDDLQTDVVWGKYDIIHFSLHGDEKMVLFSDTQQITYSRFESLFSIKSNIKAVILNICESSDMAWEIAKNVDWVLGWSDKVIADDAAEAARVFYTSLFAGNSIEDSFRYIKGNKEIKPVIYDHSVLLVEQKDTTKNTFVKDNDDEFQRSNADSVSGEKNNKNTILIVLIVLGLLFIIILVPFNKILNRRIVSDINAWTDSLKIEYPHSGSTVQRSETIIVNAKLRSGGKPWIFILPPGGSEWWPQSGGIQEDEKWYFPITLGNEVDSGKFRVIALILKDSIAMDMQQWYNSQATDIKSDPLSDEVVRSFFCGEADTADYNRINK